MYSHPPQIATTNVPVTNVAGNTTLIAAPGDGKRIRVVGIHARLAQNGGAGNYDLDLQDGVGGASLALPSVTTNQRFISIPIPEPGIQLSNNTLLNAVRLGSIAGPTTVQIIVYYYVDAVN